MLFLGASLWVITLTMRNFTLLAFIKGFCIKKDCILFVIGKECIHRAIFGLMAQQQEDLCTADIYNTIDYTVITIFSLLVS